MLKITTLVAFLLFFSSSIFSQCLMYEVPLEQRIKNAELIVEGKVISQKSFWNEDFTRIYTSSTLEIYKVCKGNATSTQLDIITQGGRVGTDLHVVHPSLKLAIGQIGLFFLQEGKFLSYEPYASEQGHIKYDMISKTATDPFKKYIDIKAELYQVIEKHVGYSYKIVGTITEVYASQKNSSAISISSFSPDSVYAGTGDYITIIGSGFGNLYTGSANIEFKNPDDGGATYASVPADHILLWTDAQIIVAVPASYTSGSNPGAGTGTIRVTNSSGSSVESSTEIVVVFNEIVIEYSGSYYYPDLVDKNTLGGYSWAYNNGFNSNSAAVAAIERAIGSWNCGTQINIRSSGVTSTNCDGDDGENIISFDGSCPLPSGVLGTNFSYYSGCFNALIADYEWNVKGTDILFAVSPGSGYSWNYGPTASASNQYDFESVALHEMGHTHQLSHIIAPGKVMNYALFNGDDERTLDNIHDVGGGDDIMSRSTVNNGCGPTAMIPASTTNCALAPVAAFASDLSSGCAPLTVNFTDATANGPTSWQWDFDNNGTVDATSQHPSYTYTAAGTYTVKLTATNSLGSDTEIQTSYLSVYASPVADFQASSANTTTGTSIQFTDLSTGSPIIWNWDFGDGSSASQHPTHTYNSVGTYSVSLIIEDGNGCLDTLEKSNYINVSVQTDLVGLLNSSAAIKIIPNPFSNTAVISIENSSFSNEKIILTCYDMLGQKVNLNMTNENGKLILHKGHLPSGVYYSEVIYENRSIAFIKIVIQ